MNRESLRLQHQAETFGTIRGGLFIQLAFFVFI
jgi:hypothetical protein